MYEVKRYHIVQDYTKAGDYMKEFDDGRWVKHSDHLTTVQALQAELDKKSVPPESGMTVEEIANLIPDSRVRGDNNNAILWNKSEIAKAIQPLTVAQGFQPDWSKAPEWATYVSLVWTDQAAEAECFDAIPRPPKVTRERTRDWKINKLLELRWESYEALKETSTRILDWALELEGISLTEEV